MTIAGREAMNSEPAPSLRALVLARGWRSIALRAAILAAGWWTLTGGRVTGAPFGAVVVGIALVVSLALPSIGAPRWRPGGLVRFAGVFLIGSVHGGVDVARRAFAPSLPVAPDLLTYEVRLPAGPPTFLFASALSLMPGTSSVTLDGRSLVIHTLVSGPQVLGDIERLEQAIAGAVGHHLEPARA